MARRRKEDRFESYSLAAYLSRPFRSVWRKISRLSSNDRIRDRQTNPVTDIFLFPIRILFAAIVFLVNSWAITRAGRPFLWGIPALFVVTGVTGAAWLDYFRYPNKVAKTQRYYENFLKEPRRGPAIAEHFALKQVGLQPDNEQAKFNLALIREQLGEFQKAEDLMSYLCERDFLLAHVWYARRYLGGAHPQISDSERNEKVLYHVESALRIDPESSFARIAKADHFLVQAVRYPEGSDEYKEYLEKASEELIAVSDSDSGEIVWHLPKLMKIQFDLGQSERAKKVYQNSRKMLLIFVKKFPSDDRIPQVWNVLISSAIQLKDYKGAMELIEEGKRESGSSQLNKMFEEMLSRMFVQQASDFKNLEDPEQFDSALEILGKGIMQSPTNIAISNKLVEFIVPTGKDKKALPEQLEKSVNAASVAHLLRGIHKVARGDVLGGQTHWKIAATQNPLSEIILFSLVRSLITAVGDEFENKEDVIALAIENYPNQGLFYFLRGLHSMQVGDHQQAVSDLIQAIQMTSEPSNFEIHVQLARCYLILKDQENADAVMRTIQKMIQRAEPSRREVLEEYLKQLNEL